MCVCVCVCVCRGGGGVDDERTHVSLCRPSSGRPQPHLRRGKDRWRLPGRPRGHDLVRHNLAGAHCVMRCRLRAAASWRDVAWHTHGMDAHGCTRLPTPNTPTRTLARRLTSRVCVCARARQQLRQFHVGDAGTVRGVCHRAPRQISPGSPRFPLGTCDLHFRLGRWYSSFRLSEHDASVQGTEGLPTHVCGLQSFHCCPPCHDHERGHVDHRADGRPPRQPGVGVGVLPGQRHGLVCGHVGLRHVCHHGKAGAAAACACTRDATRDATRACALVRVGVRFSKRVYCTRVSFI